MDNNENTLMMLKLTLDMCKQQNIFVSLNFFFIFISILFRASNRILMLLCYNNNNISCYKNRYSNVRISYLSRTLDYQRIKYPNDRR